jgi:hypothetical protein
VDFKRHDTRRRGAAWSAESADWPTYKKFRIYSDRLPHRAFKFRRIGLSTA